jgi:soluble cytochrome b562
VAVAAAEPELDEESKVLIAAKMAEAEALGEEGEVDEAQRKLEEVEAIKRMASIRAAPSRYSGAC